MVRVVVKNADLFKESMRIIADLVSEVTLVFSEKGLEIVAMDPATVAMVIFKMPPTAFSEMHVDGTERLTVNLILFRQILRRAGKNDTIRLESQEGKLSVTITGKTTRQFTLPLLEETVSEEDVPDLEFDVSITLPSSLLDDAIADVDVVSDSVALIADKKSLTLEARGDMTDARITFTEDDDITLVYKSDHEHVRSKYSIEYLKKMISASKLASRVGMHFSTDYPLKLDYTSVDEVSMTFILAPRMDEA